MSTRRETVARLTRRLTPLYGVREAHSIALLVAAEYAGVSTSALLTDPDVPCGAAGLDAASEELAAGRPVQYVLGHTEFCGIDLAVREGVLIPRPETEELVCRIARTHPGARRILDVGTGSGCIALALKNLLPHAEISAADISDEALAVAAENARRSGLQVVLRRADALSDLAEVFAGPFDVVVSNPPYVPAGDRASMHPNVRDHEPALALFVPDDDPLRFYRAIARAARSLLGPGGALWFEIYEHAGDGIRRLLAAEGFARTQIYDDLYGKPRMTCSRKR